MKKRNESDNQARIPSPDRLSMSRKGEGQESAKDFALHLAAMFRAELGEEDEQLDPVLNWELPVFEADYQEAAVDSGSDEDLYRAVADFLDDEVGEPAGDAQEDDFAIPSISARSDREAQRRAEREAKRQAEQEAQRRAEREAKRQTEQEAQRRTEREAKRQAEQEAQRRTEREAKRQAERPAPPQTETPAQERLVFFEPKQKKHSFFDSLTETLAAEEPASAPLPAEPPRRERRTDSTAAEQPSRRGQTTGASRREQTAGSTRRGQTRDNTRRPEKRPARRGEREDPTRRMATQARRDGRRDSPENAGFAEQLDAFRDPTMVSLRGFSTTPFEPPREDPSLEELFGPLGLKTAPPDPDDSPTRRGRTPRSAFDLPVDDPIRPLPSDEAAAADKATGNGQQATGEKGSGIEDQGSGIEDQGSGIEDQGSGIRDQGSGIRDQGSGWMQDVGAVIDRPPEAEALDELVGAVIGRPPEAEALDEPVGAVIDRPPEAEAFDEPVGAVIGRPPEAEALDEPVGAVIGRPPEAEAFDEPVGAVIGRPPEAETLDEPVGAVIDRPPEAEAFNEPVGAVIDRPPEAEVIDEPVEAGAFDGPIIAADNETDKPIEPAESVVPTASDEPALEEAASEADAPWSDDKLFAAVEALLDRPFFAGIDGLNDTTASGDVSAARDAAELEKAAQAKPGQSAAGVPSRREFDALTVPELFDYFGLPRTEERSETKDQGSETEDQRSETEDQGSETGEETAPAAPDGTSAGTSIACPPSPEPTEPQAEAVSEKAPEAEHAPELWDPLSLFSAPVDDGPPPLTPLSRDTTGTLPSLEELFGPAKEPAARAQRPAARPARRRQKRSWLQKLLGTAPARRERPRPQAADEATGDRQQPTVEKGSGIKDQGSGWMQGAEAVGDRPPEAEAFREDTAHTDGSLPSAPTQAEGSDIPAAADLSMVPDIPTAADIPAAPDIPAVPDLSKVPDIPAASDIPPASETIPGDVGSADDWDPLALFGGQAEDGELPTWAEYVRSRRAAAEAEAPTPGAEPEEESLGSLPEDVPEVPEETPAASVNRKADWPEIPELDRDPTLEELFGPGGTGEQDAETVPMDLSAAPEPAASGRNRRRSQTDALTLSDFLTAAVPMEEAAAAGKEPAGETLREAAREQTLTFGPAEPQTISTAPENPMGLILTWLDDKEEEPSGEETAGDWEQAREADSLAGAKPPKAAVSAAEYSTLPVSAASRRDSGADRADMDRSQEAEASGRTAGDSANGAQAEPDPFAGAHSVRPPEIRSPEKAPVPSADVRTSAGVAAAADKRSRRRERQDIEVLPPEEKTILHPEEAYRVYARPLDAIGSRLILTGLFTLLSLFFTLYLAQRWTFLPEIFSGGTTVYILLGLVALLVLVNRKLYFTEWRDENGLRPALLLGLATAFTALDCISAAKTLRPPFTVVVGGLLLVELWGRYDRGMALTTTVKVLRAEQLSAGVSEVQDITKGSRGLIRTKPDVERFMEKLETRDLTDRLLRIYTPVAAGIGLLLTLVISLWLKRDPFWTGALVFLGTVPVTGLLAFPRLFCLLARRLTEAQAALCGYHGAEVFGGEHSILIGDDDIFPAGSLTLNGFKVYNGNPDRMIAYAAAACRSSGSALDPIFEDLLVTHNGRHYTVDNFRFYDSGGIGASIQQDVVLLGSLDFMRRMGVHMDRGARVKQAVYMSLNGELAAVFAVRYNPPENLRRGLAAIAGNRHFKGILVTRTFLGTPGFLKAKFGIPTGAFAYPSTKERIRLSEAEMKRSGAQGAILAKDSFSGFAQAAAGGRLLRSATLGAAILTVLGGLTGLVLMGVLAALAALETATALNILLYVAAWLAPTLLLTAWARHF